MKEKGLSLVFATAVISGFSIFLNKFGAEGIDPFLFTGVKNVLTAVFLLAAIVFVLNPAKILSMRGKDWFVLFVIGLVGGCIPFLLFFKGLSITSAAKAAFIHKSMFVFVALFAFFLLKEKLQLREALGAALLVGGTALLLKLAWSPLNYGDLLVFLAMLLWSVEIVLSKRILNHLDGIQVAFGRMFFGSLFIIAFLGITGNYSISSLTSSHLFWSFFSAVLLLGYVWTFYSGLKYVRASVAAVILMFGSVVTTLLTVAYSGDVDMVKGLGVILISAGVFVCVGFSSLLSLTKFLQYKHSVSLRNHRL